MSFSAKVKVSTPRGADSYQLMIRVLLGLGRLSDGPDLGVNLSQNALQDVSERFYRSPPDEVQGEAELWQKGLPIWIPSRLKALLNRCFLVATDAIYG